MKSILEKLEPHEDLEILEIRDYPDSQLPGWVQSCSLLSNIVEMRLISCNQCTELPAFGNLVFLQTLVITGMGSVSCIGHEFYGYGAGSSSGSPVIAFPKLQSLEMEEMESLEVWELPISKDTKILPFLCQLKLKSCRVLRALPCLGSLESLERLELEELLSVKYLGNEFYGFGADSSFDVEMVTFPKLKMLKVQRLVELEEWDIAVSKDIKIMPFLSELELHGCSKLRTLPRVWRIESLEILRLQYLNSVKGVGVEFLGVVDENERLLQDGVTFPKLRELDIGGLHGLEKWSIPLTVPCLVKLNLSGFPKLKTLPTFSCMKTLQSLSISGMEEWEGQEKIVINHMEEKSEDSCLGRLKIQGCSKLRLVPDYMFSPSLERLILSGDVGVLFDSFPDYSALCSITKVSVSSLPHSWIPKGFNLLKELRKVSFQFCKTLDFDLKELGHLTMLQQLKISCCSILEERFKGDDWRAVLIHVSTIYIDGDEITKKR